MSNFDVIQKFDSQALVALLRRCGRDAAVGPFNGGKFELAKCSIDCPSGRTSYGIAQDGETLKFISSVDSSRPLSINDFVDWNNLERITPIAVSGNAVILKFDINISRSMTFGAFAKAVELFEQAASELHSRFA